MRRRAGSRNALVEKTDIAERSVKRRTGNDTRWRIIKVINIYNKNEAAAYFYFCRFGFGLVHFEANDGSQKIETILIQNKIATISWKSHQKPQILYNAILYDCRWKMQGGQRGGTQCGVW